MRRMRGSWAPPSRPGWPSRRCDARTEDGDPFAGPCLRCMMSRKRSFVDQGEKGRTNFPAVISRRHRITLAAWSLRDSRPFRFLCPIIVAPSRMGCKGFVLRFVAATRPKY